MSFGDSLFVVQGLNLTELLLKGLSVLGIRVHPKQFQAQICTTGFTGNCGFQRLCRLIHAPIRNVGVGFRQRVTLRCIRTVFVIQGEIEGIGLRVGFTIQLVVKRFFTIGIATRQQQQKQQQNNQTTAKRYLIHRVVGNRADDVIRKALVRLRR